MILSNAITFPERCTGHISPPAREISRCVYKITTKWEALTRALDVYHLQPTSCFCSVLRGTAVFASKASPRAERFLRRLFLWSHLVLMQSLQRGNNTRHIPLSPDTSNLVSNPDYRILSKNSAW